MQPTGKNENKHNFNMGRKRRANNIFSKFKRKPKY